MTMHANIHRLSGVKTTNFAPGQEAKQYRPGDFILTHGKAWTSVLIRIGQSLKYWGEDKKYAWWSHAAMIVAEDGTLIEAIGSGVRQGNISEYKDTDYMLVCIDGLADDRDREQTAKYARECLNQEYGYLTLVCIGLGLLTGMRLSFGVDGQSICSGLVARALERTDAIFDRDPANIMPADLAKYFNLTPPLPGSSKGSVPKFAVSP